MHRMSALEKESQAREHSLRQECSEIANQCEETKAQLEAVMSERNSLEGEVKICKGRIDGYDKEIEALKLEIAGFQEALNVANTMASSSAASAEANDFFSGSSPLSSPSSAVGAGVGFGFGGEEPISETRGDGADESEAIVEQLRIELEESQGKVEVLSRELETVRAEIEAGSALESEYKARMLSDPHSDLRGEQSEPSEQYSLPHGWIQLYDTTSQRPYFVDTSSGQSHWHLPVTPISSPDVNSMEKLRIMSSELAVEREERERLSGEILRHQATVVELTRSLEEAKHEVVILQQEAEELRQNTSKSQQSPKEEEVLR